jgi:putative glutamine amidotransferase
LNKRPPLVLVTSCNQTLGLHAAHTVIRKYVDAVRLAGALPLIAPPFEEAQLDALLDAVDGVLLTGSPSNVHPSHFGQAVHNPALPLDPERDAWTLPLIRKTLARGQPLLAICRGTQEVNVALGGSLHQAVQEVPGHTDHRCGDDDALAVQYRDVHAVNVTPGGVLHGIVGKANFQVNSLHGQAIDRLASGLRVEATAPDGVIEAVSATQTQGFSLCLQWHPEWQAATNPVSMQILQAFRQALCTWRDRVRGPLPAPAEVT